MPGEGVPERRTTEEAVAAAQAGIKAAEAVDKPLVVRDSRGQEIGRAATQAEAQAMIQAERDAR